MDPWVMVERALRITHYPKTTPWVATAGGLKFGNVNFLYLGFLCLNVQQYGRIHTVHQGHVGNVKEFLGRSMTWAICMPPFTTVRGRSR
jgi:hypothetical protein